MQNIKKQKSLGLSCKKFLFPNCIFFKKNTFCLLSNCVENCWDWVHYQTIEFSSLYDTYYVINVKKIQERLALTLILETLYHDSLRIFWESAKIKNIKEEWTVSGAKRWQYLFATREIFRNEHILEPETFKKSFIHNFFPYIFKYCKT